MAAEGSDGRLRSLRIRDADGAESTEDADACFVFIGAAPRTDWLDGVVARWRAGGLSVGDAFDTVAAEFDIKRTTARLHEALTRAFATTP